MSEWLEVLISNHFISHCGAGLSLTRVCEKATPLAVFRTFAQRSFTLSHLKNATLFRDPLF